MKTQTNGIINELTEATNAKWNNSLMGTRISESGRCFEFGSVVFEYVTELERLKASRGPINKVVYQMDGAIPGLYIFRWGRWENIESEQLAEAKPRISLTQHLKSRFVNFFACALLLLSISCSDSDLEVAPNLSGTTWRQHNTTDANGRKIYKVLQFINSVVKIDYRFENDDLYYHIGEFTYIYSSPEFWVKNPDNTISQGSIISSHIRFGGEIFDKR